MPPAAVFRAAVQSGFEMSYDAALAKAWKDVRARAGEHTARSVPFFRDTYLVDIPSGSVVSCDSGVPAKDFVAILVLHYLARSFDGLPPLSGQWISFKELPGGDSYYPAYRKRAIDPVIRKYGREPSVLLAKAGPAAGAPAGQADAAVIVESFPSVPLMIEVWGGDDEFGADANILFDKNISAVFCTEDVAVLAGFIGKYV